MRNLLMTTLSALTLAACAAGPDYARPAPPAASSGPFLSTREGVTTTAPAPNDADPEWWRLYKDPVLDGLVADARKDQEEARAAFAWPPRASPRRARPCAKCAATGSPRRS
mgnify:CR=1 FL=1